MEWFVIISSLLGPLLAKCQQATSSEDPQEMLRESYNETTGRMDESIVRSAVPATRQAIRKAWRNATKEERKTFPRYSRSEVYEIAEAKLIEAMNADPATLQAAFETAAAMDEG